MPITRIEEGNFVAVSDNDTRWKILEKFLNQETKQMDTKQYASMNGTATEIIERCREKFNQ